MRSIAEEAQSLIKDFDRRGISEYGVGDEVFVQSLMRVIAAIQRGNFITDEGYASSTANLTDEQEWCLKLPKSDMGMAEVLFYLIHHNYKLSTTGSMLSGLMDDSDIRVYVSILRIIHANPARIPYAYAGFTDTDAIDGFVANDIDIEMARALYV